MIDDAAINAWAGAIGLGKALSERPDEVRAAAHAALALAARIGTLDDSAVPPCPRPAP